MMAVNDRILSKWCRQTWSLLKADGQPTGSLVGLCLCGRNRIPIPRPWARALQLVGSVLCTGCSASTSVPKFPRKLPPHLIGHTKISGGCSFYTIQCFPPNSGTQIRIFLTRKMWGKGFACGQPLSSAYTREKWLPQPWSLLAPAPIPANQSSVSQGILCPNSFSWERSSD